MRLDEIINRVETETDIPAEEICGQSRLRHIVIARHMAMAAARDLGMTQKHIGWAIGRRDHSTVIHGIKRADHWERVIPGWKRSRNRIVRYFIEREIPVFKSTRGDV